MDGKNVFYNCSTLCLFFYLVLALLVIVVILPPAG